MRRGVQKRIYIPDQWPLGPLYCWWRSSERKGKLSIRESDQCNDNIYLEGNILNHSRAHARSSESLDSGSVFRICHPYISGEGTSSKSFRQKKKKWMILTLKWHFERYQTRQKIDPEICGDRNERVSKGKLHIHLRFAYPTEIPLLQW